MLSKIKNTAEIKAALIGKIATKHAATRLTAEKTSVAVTADNVANAPSTTDILLQLVPQVKKKNFLEVAFSNLEQVYLTKLKKTEQLSAGKTKFINLKLNCYENKLGYFCELSENLSNKLLESNVPAQKIMGHIILSELIKIHEGLKNNNKAIELAKRSVELCERSQDKVHLLGRLHTIQECYFHLGDKQNNYQYLKKSLACIDDILGDYDGAARNYRSINKPMPPVANLKKEKAHICMMIGHLLEKTNNEKAIKYLKKAQNVFVDLKDYHAADHIELQIQHLNIGKNPNRKNGKTDRKSSKYNINKNEKGCKR